MKKIISIASALIIAAAAVPGTVFAADKEYTAGGFTYTYTAADGEVTITGASGEGAVLVIPDSIDGSPVTAIGSNVLAGSTTIASVTVPDSVKSIGSRSFSACPELMSVTIGSGTESIGDYVFAASPALSYITVNSANEVYSSAGGSLYKGDCLVLYAGGENAVIPDNVTAIGDRAFFGKTSLVSVTIPENVGQIGEYAFTGCFALKSIKIPETVTDIGTGCFMNCTSLTVVSGAEGLKAVPDRCFNLCTSLSTFEIADSVTAIGANAFFGCAEMDGLYIPESAANIADDSVGRAASARNSASENIEGFTIRGEKGSAAEVYAVQYGINFIEGRPVSGDVNGDDIIDARDASTVLAEYAYQSSGKPSILNGWQSKSGDYNKDGIVDARDASLILAEYARQSVMPKER